MSKHLGDYDASAVIYGKFATFRPSTGATFTLAGSPVLSVYKDSSTTQSTTGVTLTADFDSVTGLNHFAIDTSADGTFYSAGSFFDIVITTGTVDSVSITGAVVGGFTIRKNSALKPATAGRTIVVDSSGLADANVVKLGPTGSGTSQTARDIGASVLLSSGAGTGQLDFTSGVVKGNVTKWNGTAVNGTVPPDSTFIRSGTAQAGATASITLDSGASSVDDLYKDCQIFIRAGTGAGQVNLIASYVGSTKVATVASEWATNPDNTSDFTVLADGPSAATVTGTVTLGAADSMNLDTGTAQAGALGSITLRSGAAATDNLYRFLEVTIYSGTGAGQSRVITGYVGSTKVASVDENWIATPDNTSMYRVSVIRSPKVDSTGSITIQAPVKKNKAMNGMPFYVRLNTGGPAIGLGSGLTAQRNVDNGGWGVGALGGVSEMGNGWYFLASASASDMNGDSVAFRFAGAGCVDTLVTLFPVP